jgi:type VI secretion system secreted protein VgrG
MVAHATLLVDGAPREVLAFRGRERLSSCFRFDVELRPPGGDARAWLGERAVLTLEVAGEIRTIAGVVGKVQIGRHGGDVMVRLVPGMRLAAHRRTSRVFQDIAVVDIARRILHEHGLALEATLTRRPTKREMCVQHQESDLAFIERLFAEVGYAYRFETVVVDGMPTERVHVFDAATAYREIGGDPRLVFQSAGGGGTAMRREEHHVTHFVEDAAVAVERVLVREFDFRNPASFPSEAATVAAGAGAAGGAATSKVTAGKVFDSSVCVFGFHHT